MTDKDRIRQEIERIEQILDDFNKANNNTIDNGIVSAKKNICKHIKSFINSLPEPSRESWEEDGSFEKLLQEIYVKYDKKISIESLLDIASHFAEWQKQKDEKLFKEDTWNYIEEQYPDVTKEEKLRLYDVSIKSRLAGAKTQKKLGQETIELAEEHAMLAGMEKMKEEMKAKEHINNIISCLEEYLQPGFPIFKAGISKEITWLNSLINKND